MRIVMNGICVGNEHEQATEKGGEKVLLSEVMRVIVRLGKGGGKAKKSAERKGEINPACNMAGQEVRASWVRRRTKLRMF